LPNITASSSSWAWSPARPSLSSAGGGVGAPAGEGVGQLGAVEALQHRLDQHRLERFGDHRQASAAAMIGPLEAHVAAAVLPQ
jgi:hypothetical protein